MNIVCDEQRIAMNKASDEVCRSEMKLYITIYKQVKNFEKCYSCWEKIIIAWIRYFFISIDQL